MRILEFCKKYKYILTIIAFAAYLFFGENNVIENFKLNSKINELEFELENTKEMIAIAKEQNVVSPYSNKEEQEEYFRKQHHYKKENEDIFRLVSVSE